MARQPTLRVRLELLDLVYSAGAGESWDRVLDKLAQLTSGIGTSIERYRHGETDPTLWISRGLPRDWVDAYRHRYNRINPRLPTLQSRPAGSVVTDYDSVSESQLDREEFYADFLARYHLRYYLGAVLERTQTHCTILAIHRSDRQGAADREQIATLQWLTPHLCRAFAAHARLATAPALEETFKSVLFALRTPTILTDRFGAVWAINEDAEQVVARVHGLEIRRGTIHARPRLPLETLLGRAEDARLGLPPPVPIAVGSPPDRCVLAAVPLPTRAALGWESEGLPTLMLFLLDTRRAAARTDATVLRLAYDLSRAEADVVTELSRGISLREQAEHRRVSYNTTRTLLARARQKMGANTQADVVRLVLALEHPGSKKA